MARLVLFTKGNLDLRDSLHSLTIGGRRLWNGINEIVRARFPGTTIRLRHETWTRSDALLASAGDVPLELAEKSLALGAYSLPSQFSRTLFETDADAFILSLQPDVSNFLFRSRFVHQLFCPNNHEEWPIEDSAAPICDAEGIILGVVVVFHLPRVVPAPASAEEPATETSPESGQ